MVGSSGAPVVPLWSPRVPKEPFQEGRTETSLSLPTGHRIKFFRVKKINPKGSTSQIKIRHATSFKLFLDRLK